MDLDIESQNTIEKIRKADKVIDPKRTNMFPKANPANIASVPNTVGEVRPTFGVRMKSSLKLKGANSRQIT